MKCCSIALIGVMLCAASTVFAKPISESQIPPALKDWVDWVLHDESKYACPIEYNRALKQTCAFPSLISLKLNNSGGTFSQVWRTFEAADVALPGNEKFWPQDVFVDGKRAPVMRRGNNPFVRVPGGRYKIEGKFAWDRVPNALEIPAQSGIVLLSLNGNQVDNPPVNGTRLFLGAEDAAPKPSTSNSLEVRVFRQVEDGIPLRVTTHFDIVASGENRAETISNWALADFKPMQVISSLPVQIDNKGAMRVQLRPGKWSIKVKSRSLNNVTELSRPPVEEPLPASEIWVFAPDDKVRSVAITGVQTIDPSQSMLPSSWQGLAAYQVGPEDKFTIDVKKRGNPDPAPDQLRLNRTIWLDFDGGGYTVQDKMEGTVNRSWRLEMLEPAQLGRVAVNGDSQLITKSKNGKAGVQLTQGKISVEADSRINDFMLSLPASGWDVDLQQMSARLFLPPGWKIFWAAGVDHTYGTWLWTWNLLNLFMLLVFAIGFGKLKGRLAGIIGGAALVLVTPEAEYFQYLLVFLLPSLAIGTLVTNKKVIMVNKWYRNSIGLVLVLCAITFAVTQWRIALFPTMERPNEDLLGGYGAADTWNVNVALPGTSSEPATDAVVGGEVYGDAAEYEDEEFQAPVDSAKVAKEKNMPMQQQLPMPKKKDFKRGGGGLLGGSGGLSNSYSPVNSKLTRNLVQYDPKANIQTGPGLPVWTWNSINLSWSGPVTKEQTIKLWLMPPWLNFILAFLRVILLVITIGMVFNLDQFFGKGKGDWRGLLAKLKLMKTTGLVILAVALLAPRPAVAEVPSKDMLAELKNRLIENPECSPNCASLQRLRVDASGRTLTLRMEITAGARTVLPLPGNSKHWLPTSVLIDGTEASAIERRSDGQLWLVVEEGYHQVVARGPLGTKETVQLNFPVTPGYTSFVGNGWQADGLLENGRVEGSLTINRSAVGNAPGPANTDSETRINITPFVQVNRHVSLGLEWLVTTTVTRLAGEDSAVNVAIPLLPGEQVTSQDVRVRDGKVELSMAPNQSTRSWEGTIKPVDQLTFKASDSSNWIETWKINLSPIWNITTEGIPVIYQQSSSGAREPFWQPWPGEEMTASINRPAAVDGETMTVDKAGLSITPGQRNTDVKLSLVVRASLGRDFTITLPEEATFQGLLIDGSNSVLKPNGRKLTVNLKPGSQTIVVDWREPSGIGLVFRSSDVEIGQKAVNASLEVNMPANRWTLWFMGDGAGPAILFWSKVIVLLLLAIVLGNTGLTPLRPLHWFLLGLGLIQSGIFTAAIVAGFLLLVGYRATQPKVADWWFNLRQLLLGVAAFAAGICFLVALEKGFFGRPDMQIMGNLSSYTRLNWFVDRIENVLPTAFIFSVPILVYKVAMLLWALWVAFSMIKWSRWLWESFGAGGFWIKLKPSKSWSPRFSQTGQSTPPSEGSDPSGGPDKK